jgi:leucine dehydrogenase
MEISLEPLIVNPHFDEHERVVVLHDSAKGLKGIICIHSTALGPAMGGCRSASYDSPDAALSDALRLSQGMSYENALAGGGDPSPWAALGGGNRRAAGVPRAPALRRAHRGAGVGRSRLQALRA